MIYEENNIYSKIKYLSYFVVRSLLISIICFFSLLLIVGFVYFGDLIINVKSGNYKNPIFGGYIIVSQSMIPTININDAIVVKRSNNNNYKVGDIISFFSTEYEKSGVVITHRVVDKVNGINEKLLYITKGDNNSVVDKQGVYSDDIYGRVMFIIPKLGYIRNFFSNTINLICCIIMPSLFIIIVDFIRIGILFKKKREVV